MPLEEVELATVDPSRFASILSVDEMTQLRDAAERARAVLDGRTVWNVNSTAKGGGVAEMLTTLLPYARGAGIDTRWLVIGGDDDFFAITKRIHNRLHGNPGDGEGLDDADRQHYDEVLAPQGEAIAAQVRSGDVVILHDPQTAGLVDHMKRAGAHVVWRCHVGVDDPNDHVRDTWRFLLRHVDGADLVVFSRQSFVWDGITPEKVRIVMPSIDPFSPKNYVMDDASVHGVLEAAGLMDDGGRVPATYTRADGGQERIEHRAEVVESQRLGPETPLVVQVSRWDRLKDPVGVLTGFVEGVLPRCDAHLLLAGPSVAEVADDPEGQETFNEVRRVYEGLDVEARAHVHLACLPMIDDEENAVMVNALQRRAHVVVQKSLAEGFGLTVSEAMWKSRPVVASAVGGIQDQVDDGVGGILLDDPHDLAAFGEAVCGLLSDPDRARAMGEAAHARVARDFLNTRHLIQYARLCEELVGSRL
ncbi:MAG: glycosyltransferase [Candidatus Dormibacteria bacterium]